MSWRRRDFWWCRQAQGASQLIPLSKLVRFYDANSRVFQEDVYGQDPTTGQLTAVPLSTSSWFDASGNLIASNSPGSSAIAKTVFDELDRAVSQFLVLPADDWLGEMGSSCSCSSSSSSSSSSSDSDSSSSEPPGGGDSSSASSSGHGDPPPPPPPDHSDSSTDTSDSGGGGGDGGSPSGPDGPSGSGSDDGGSPSDGGSSSSHDDGSPSDGGSPSDDGGPSNSSGGKEPPPETKKCPCPEETTGLCPEVTSGYPVRYSSGQLSFASNDLSSRAFGLFWGHTRNYRNVLAGDRESEHGQSWVVEELSHIQFGAGAGNSQAVVIIGGSKNLWFQPSGDDWTALFSHREQLIEVPSTQETHLLYPDGSTQIYYSKAAVASLRDKLKAMLQPNGRRVELVYNAAGQVLRFQQTNPSGASCRFEYQYYQSGAKPGSQGRMATVTKSTGTAANLLTIFIHDLYAFLHYFY